MYGHEVAMLIKVTNPLLWQLVAYSRSCHDSSQIYNRSEMISFFPEKQIDILERSHVMSVDCGRTRHIIQVFGFSKINVSFHFSFRPQVAGVYNTFVRKGSCGIYTVYRLPRKRLTMSFGLEGIRVAHWLSWVRVTEPPVKLLHS